MAGRGLTPRQEEAARLAVQGLSAAKVAARLGIARSTADTLLRAAYGRTGTRDRAGLRRWLEDRGSGR